MEVVEEQDEKDRALEVMVNWPEAVKQNERVVEREMGDHLQEPHCSMKVIAP